MSISTPPFWGREGERKNTGKEEGREEGDEREGAISYREEMEDGRTEEGRKEEGREGG